MKKQPYTGCEANMAHSLAAGFQRKEDLSPSPSEGGRAEEVRAYKKVGV